MHEPRPKRRNGVKTCGFSYLLREIARKMSSKDIFCCFITKSLLNDKNHTYNVTYVFRENLMSS